MLYALVQWVKTGGAAVFDVVSVRDIVETKITALIIQNPKDSGVVNANVNVRWRGEKHAAKIIAVGTHTQMEKKCRQQLKRVETCDGLAEASDEGCENCVSLGIENSDLKEQVALLQEENKRLKSTIDFITTQKESIEECTEAIRDIRLLYGELQAAGTLRCGGGETQDENTEDLEDIGGYMISRSVLKMLDMGPLKTPSTYARDLLRQVFSPAELVGKSISGRQSNAHRDKEAKPQLDPVRVNAVLKYTCKKYGLIKEAPIRQSLSSMLNKQKLETEAA